MSNPETLTRAVGWYNYRTGDYDYNPDLTSDTVARQYIPQNVAAQGIYDCHRGMGQSITEAMIATLTAVIRAQEGGHA
jgi:replication-associated recombination protein RarA